MYAAIFGKNVVSVIDGSTDTVIKNIPVGDSPRALAVFASGSRRRVYVANRYSDNVSIIDAETRRRRRDGTDGCRAQGDRRRSESRVRLRLQPRQRYRHGDRRQRSGDLDDPGRRQPHRCGRGPGGRRVFVANYLGNSVSVIDADTLSVVATVSTGVQPIAIAVDRSSRKAYVSCYGSSSVTVIDSSLAATSIATGDGPYALGVDEALDSHQVYSANWGADSVTMIDPPGGDAGPVTVTIDPMSGDTTSSTSPVFTGTASSSRAPLQSNIVAVFYRIDADQTWRRAQIVEGRVRRR